MPHGALHAIDARILGRLQEDARLSNVELAQAVGLSPSPCLRRVRALERGGGIPPYLPLFLRPPPRGGGAGPGRRPPPPPLPPAAGPPARGGDSPALPPLPPPDGG